MNNGLSTDDLSISPYVRNRRRVVNALLYGDNTMEGFDLAHRISECGKKSRKEFLVWVEHRNKFGFADIPLPSSSLASTPEKQTNTCQSLWCLRCRKAASLTYLDTLNKRLSERLIPDIPSKLDEHELVKPYVNSDFKHITGLVGVCPLKEKDVTNLLNGDTIRWRRIRNRVRRLIPISRSPFVEAVYEFELVDWKALKASPEDESVYKKKQIEELRNFHNVKTNKLVLVHFHGVTNLTHQEIVDTFGKEYFLGGERGKRLTKTDPDTGMFIQNFHGSRTLEHNLRKIASYPFKSATRYKHSFVGSDYSNGEYFKLDELAELVLLYQKIQKRNWRGLFRSVTNPSSVGIAQYRKRYPSVHPIWREWSSVVEPVWIVDPQGGVYKEGWDPNTVLDVVKSKYEFRLGSREVLDREFFALPDYPWITAYKNIWGPLRYDELRDPLQGSKLDQSMDFDQFYQSRKKKRMQRHKSNSERLGYQYVLVEKVSSPWGTVEQFSKRPGERYTTKRFKPVSLLTPNNELVGTVGNYRSVRNEREFVHSCLSFLRGVKDLNRAKRISDRLRLEERLNAVESVRMTLDLDGLAVPDDEIEWLEGYEDSDYGYIDHDDVEDHYEDEDADEPSADGAIEWLEGYEDYDTSDVE